MVVDYTAAVDQYRQEEMGLSKWKRYCMSYFSTYKFEP